MRRIPVLAVLGLGLIAAGCGRGQDSRSEELESAEMPGEVGSAPGSANAGATDVASGVRLVATQPPPAPETPPAPRRIVRNAQLSLVVASPPGAADRLTRLADSLGGYASDVRAHRREDRLYYHLVLRVPAERLDVALDAIRELAVRIDSESIQAEDVTEQHVELDARLTTLRATETELQALLAESRSRGAEVEDIMAVYRELVGIRTQIEQTRAQLENLESRVALSTITLELAPEAGSGPIVRERWRPGGIAREAVRTLVDVLRVLATLAIYAVIVLLPILGLLAIPLVVLWYVLRRRFRRRRATGGA